MKLVKKTMAVILAAIFSLSSLSAMAYPSIKYAEKDYRNLDVLDKSGKPVKKPTAQFSANRVVNGEVTDMAISYVGYDCNVPFSVLECYVGDTLTFTDMSRDNNGGKIKEWDWQYFGALGDSSGVYKSNVLKDTVFNLTEPGETTFFLCVRNNSSVKQGCCDPWSENGNHQTVGRNKWFPKGGYWYFTAVRVIVKPRHDAVVNVRYWDTQNNKVFHEGYVNLGTINSEAETKETVFTITDWDGYEYTGWNVQFPQGPIQYSGQERDVKVILTSWAPTKNLNIEYRPQINTEVEVRYWDKNKNKIINTETVPGSSVTGEMQTTITVPITAPPGYTTNGWNIQLPDSSIQKEGTDTPVDVVLNCYIPKKYLNVKCYPDGGSDSIEPDCLLKVNYIDTSTEEVIKTETINAQANNEILVDPDKLADYELESWVIEDALGDVEADGTKTPITVVLSKEEPTKTLDLYYKKAEDIQPEPEIDIKPSGVCDGVINWTETDSHQRVIGYDKDNNPIYTICTHTIGYKSILNATPIITPSTLKSGYGFEINVGCNISTTLVSNDGGCMSWGNNRTPILKVNKPTNATVYVPWDVTNRLGTQSLTISMEKYGDLNFRLPISPISEAGNRRIYTPVTLAGTKEMPVAHSFEIYINGGGVGTVEFCKKLEGTITINGDMYEDDFSGAD